MVWAPDYVSVADVKAWLRIDDADTQDDAQITIYATAASRAVDSFCKRQFGKVDTAETRTFEGTWDRRLGCWVYAIDDLSSAAGLTVLDEAGSEITDSALRPLNAVALGKPYTELRCSSGGPLSIESEHWGWAAVPAAARMGALLQAARLAVRRDSPYGIAGSPSDGGEQRLLASLDPDLRTSLRSYRREVWFA